MGQAKQRGTFEQRRTEGIAKREAEETRQREEDAAREAAMTPEQKAKQHKARTIIAGVMGFAAGALSPAEAVTTFLRNR